MENFKQIKVNFEETDKSLKKTNNRKKQNNLIKI